MQESPPMRVLVIEDDSSIRQTLGMVLESYNHKADLVRDGEQALKYLEKEWPDAILLDLSLPGMSGEEVYEQIRLRFGRIPPTIVVTAVQEGEDRASRMPGAWFLAKPYTLEKLDEILNEACAIRPAA